MADVETREDGSHWPREPPGTVVLGSFDTSLRHAGHGSLVLQPQPSDDPNDPLNWSKGRKVVNYFLVSFYCLVDFAILDISTVIYPQYNTTLGTSFSQLNNTYAASTAGLAVGCVFFIPLALKYGRRPVYLVSTLVLFLTGIWLALLSTYGQLTAAMLVCGLAGATSETLVQMTIADLFFVHQRATMVSIYSLMVLIGASLAPVAAGYIAEAQGFRWIWWWCAIFLGVIFLAFALFYEETKYIPRVSDVAVAAEVHDEGESAKGKTDAADTPPDETFASNAHLSAARGSWIDISIPLKSLRQRLAFYTKSPGEFWTVFRHSWQPFQCLALFPAVLFAGIQYACVLTWLSLIVTLTAIVFPGPPFYYGSNMIGLMGLPGFIGSVVGAVYSGPCCDYYIVWKTKRSSGVFDPEMRLVLFFFPALVGPAGIFIFGYYLANGTTWIAPAMGSALFGFGSQAISTLSLTYLADCYQDIIGDSLVGVAFVRNGITTGIVFAISPWMDAMGVWNMFLLSGFLALAVNLLAVPMWWYGKAARRACAANYTRMAKRQFDPRGHVAAAN